jgi:rfaE bifunctional protein nucleotidyltransferase chain/domain
MRNKIISINKLKELREKFNLKKIGLVHGVFDLFHYGHILHLEKAKSLCDILVVSITADKFISKGPGRPFYNNSQRIKLIASLSQVNYIVLSEQKSAVEIINSLKPNFYFKGNDYVNFKNDYSKKIIREVQAVKKNNGKIIFTNEKTFSSTKLINNYSENFDKETKKYLLNISREIDFESIHKMLKKIKKMKVLIIGEAIIDKYTFTLPLGKSPKEQLIPVMAQSTEVYGGGIIATANHIINFVNDCTVLTVLSNDNKKNKNIKNLINKNIKQKYFMGTSSMNIEKNRFIDKNDNHKQFQTINLDRIELSDKTENNIINYLKKNKNKIDHIIVHDFGHGMLKSKIIKYLQTQSKKLSVNVQTNSSNVGFNYLTKYSKLNYFSIDEPEARLALQDKESNSLELFKKLKKRVKFKFGSITFGRHGTNVFDGKKLHFAPALSKNPVDTMGAGDAYFAISSLFTKITNNTKILSLVGNAAGAMKIKFLGHRKSLNKLEFLNYLKALLNI